MRRIPVSELMQIATVLAVPMAMAAIFPYAALDFRSTAESKSARPFVTFVQLDASAEHAAIQVAKSSFRGEASRDRLIRADLSFGELPEDSVRPVEPCAPDRRSAKLPPLAFGVPVYAPSAAATPPQAIPVSGPTPAKSAFSRQELLKIN